MKLEQHVNSARLGVSSAMERPEWFDGEPLELQLRNEIKTEVKRNFRLIKRRGAMRGVSAPSKPTNKRDSAFPAWQDVNQELEVVGRAEACPVDFTAPTRSVSRESTATQTSTTEREIPLREDPTCTQSRVTVESSESALGPKTLSYRDAELLMHYVDHVFPRQFRFHTQDINRWGGRGWLLWLLTKTGHLCHAALSLSALHQCILHFHSHGHKQIEVLACGVSLISFELYCGGVSDWKPYLSALVSIVTALEHDPSIVQESPRMEDSAIPFLVAVVLWFDLVSCASIGTAPCLDQGIDLERIMGCQNWAMMAIGDLATLNAWKNHARHAGTLDVGDLAARRQAIEHQLKQIRSSVDRAIRALEQITDVQDVRGLIWPVRIAGCMAVESQQSFFETLIGNVLGDVERDFGNVATILRIMKHCWHLKHQQTDQEWNWERVMAELDICALLV
ncbi:uncharacterized protein Z518_02107 [Rhinocladiella mackenziei CBS 650.93]|uniref:Uncharacterized protein n=1 Tax=Rhinocladiella mackenziei CBS 650.93 TaxID=1442369 RepID=A0A0D2INT2_9EURO|nr:uncharacterized protein Z518_02107 [Rhinocladiella mackenziei CBS 650.93]KIX07454.1 hypothetical protein Z518_02107 [Rhinocladiella mackenziei CBS 650.93]